MVHFSIDRRKTKTEVIIQPFAVKVDINVGQWELKVKTSILRKTRENACDQIAIGLVWIWLVEKLAQVFSVNQSQSEVKQYQSTFVLLFDTQLKTALYQHLFGSSELWS